MVEQSYTSIVYVAFLLFLLSRPLNLILEPIHHPLPYTCRRCRTFLHFNKFSPHKGVTFLDFFMYSTLFKTAFTPVRFHCVRGRCDRTRDCCDFGIDSQTVRSILSKQTYYCISHRISCFTTTCICICPIHCYSFELIKLNY